MSGQAHSYSKHHFLLLFISLCLACFFPERSEVVPSMSAIPRPWALPSREDLSFVTSPGQALGFREPDAKSGLR